jgi:hypothetical protein
MSATQSSPSKVLTESCFIEYSANEVEIHVERALHCLVRAHVTCHTFRNNRYYSALTARVAYIYSTLSNRWSPSHFLQAVNNNDGSHSSHPFCRSKYSFVRFLFSRPRTNTVPISSYCPCFLNHRIGPLCLPGVSF